MPRLGRKLSDWRVFIDGVEVPHLGFTITFGKNQFANGQLFLEPDKVIVQQFRPNSLIHFFVWDDQESGESYLDKYKFYAEVELTGPTHTKTPTSRSMGVAFSGLFRIFARHKLFMSSVGQQFQTTHITGGYALPQMAAGIEGSGDPFSVLALAGHFDPNKPNNGDKNLAFRGSKVGTFAERMLSFVSYLSSYNAAQRLAVVRTRLLNKIASVSDSTIGGLIPATLSNAVFQQLQGEIRANDSYLDIINRFCSQVFYSWYHVPMPFTPKTSPDQKGGGKFQLPDPETGELVDTPPQPPNGLEILDVDMLGEEKGKPFKFAREYYRNDYIFTPELFYAIPPPCNFIMPEDITDLSYLRTFDSEPTRVILNEPFFAESKAAYFAPTTILRGLDDKERHKVSAAEFFATNLAGLSKAQPTGNPMSPYHAPPHTATSGLGDINLLSVLSEDEIEKGVICTRNFNPFELFTAVAKVFEEGGSLSETFNMEASRANRINRGGISEYETIMTTIADYRYQLGIAHREANISCKGLRWAVPGFSGIIFDKDSPYMCFIAGLTLSVDASTGTESTALQLSNVRTVPHISQLQKKMLEKRFGEEKTIRAEKYVRLQEIFQKKIENILAIEKAYKDQLLSVRYLMGVGNDPPTGLGLVRLGDAPGQTAVVPYINKLLANGYVDIPASYVDALGSIAAQMNLAAAPVKHVLYAERSDVSTSFMKQNTESKTPAQLKGKTHEIRTKVFGASSSFGVGGGAARTRTFSVPLTKRERYARGDYKAYITSGYLPTFKEGQMEPSVFRISSKDRGESAQSFENVEVLLQQISALSKQIREFFVFQQNQVGEAIKNKTQAEVDALGDSRIVDAKSAAESSDEYVRSFFTELTGFTLPPTWFNKGFLAAKTTDAIYQGLLGCQPFYGEDTYFGEGLGVTHSGEFTSSEVFDQYVSFIKTLDRLFPIIGKDSGIKTSRRIKRGDSRGTTKWDELSDGNEISEGADGWIERNVQRRNATSLREFLKQHSLKIRTETSDMPVQEEFFVMEPTEAKDENTLFDFIVDEWEKFPRLKAEVTGLAGGGQVLLEPRIAPQFFKPGDPLLQEVKSSMKRPDAHPTAKFLFREGRQKLILDYAKRHFGPRAFDGR